jgi:hypothetical protein
MEDVKYYVLQPAAADNVEERNAAICTVPIWHVSRITRQILKCCDLNGSSGGNRERGRCVIWETGRGIVTIKGFYTNRRKSGAIRIHSECVGHTSQRTDITAVFFVVLTACP